MKCGARTPATEMQTLPLPTSSFITCVEETFGQSLHRIELNRRVMH